jgi:hypothetical protein
MVVQKETNETKIVINNSLSSFSPAGIRYEVRNFLLRHPKARLRMTATPNALYYWYELHSRAPLRYLPLAARVVTLSRGASRSAMADRFRNNTHFLRIFHHGVSSPYSPPSPVRCGHPNTNEGAPGWLTTIAGLCPHPCPFATSELMRVFCVVAHGIRNLALLIFIFTFSQLVENHDCLFDDACAPELALDFDCQNISTSEGISTWLMGIGAFATLYLSIKYIENPESRNPAISRAESDDIVIPLAHHE